MAKIRGTTTRAGKKTTRKVPDVVADRIERPHSGKAPKQVGSQTDLEAQSLSGQAGRRAGSVKQVGPSDIRTPAGPTGSVKRVGAANVEDVLVVEGIGGGPPYSRQGGSVKHVGPADASFRALVGTGSGGAGTPKTGRVSRTNKLLTKTPLLKSGSGRANPWSVFAGSPGSFKGRQSVRVAGGAGESVLVNGRSRAFGPVSDDGIEWVTPGGASVVGGSTGELNDPPVVVTGAADDLTDTTATLNGTVNPKGRPTSYFFEYGEDDSYGTSIPVGEDGDAGEGTVAAAVDEAVTGLTAETEYHFRLVAENSEGVIEGDDETFTTEAA